MAYLNARGAPRDRHREPPPPPRGWPPPPADGRMVPVSVPPGRENGVGDPAAGDPFLDPRRGRDLLAAEGARRDQGHGNRSRTFPVSVPPGRENGVGDPAAGDPFLDPRRGRDLLPAEGARRDQGQGNRHPVLRVPPEHPLRSLHVGYPALPLFVPVRLLLLQGGPGGKVPLVHSVWSLSRPFLPVEVPRRVPRRGIRPAPPFCP